MPFFFALLSFYESNCAEPHGSAKNARLYVFDLSLHFAPFQLGFCNWIAKILTFFFKRLLFFRLVPKALTKSFFHIIIDTEDDIVVYLSLFLTLQKGSFGTARALGYL